MTSNLNLLAIAICMGAGALGWMGGTLYIIYKHRWKGLAASLLMFLLGFELICAWLVVYGLVQAAGSIAWGNL